MDVDALYSVSQKSPPPEIFWHFFPNGWEFLFQILHAYYKFLFTLDYKFLFNYLQLWQRYATLSTTTIMCSKCPPSTETHAGWSHLIWHNFVKVAGNWIKIRSLASIGTRNRQVKFGWKISNSFRKIATIPQGGFFWLTLYAIAYTVGHASVQR